MNRSGSGAKNVERFERLNGLVTALYKNYFHLLIRGEMGVTVLQIGPRSGLFHNL